MILRYEMERNSELFRAIVIINLLFCCVGQQQWPVPYDDYCQHLAVKARVYNMLDIRSICVRVAEKRKEFHGSQPSSKKIAPTVTHIMHDAIAFKNTNTGYNYTMEWYELVELFNCTFAHVLKNDTTVWCNQGAACIYDGVDDRHWQQNGTLVKVAEITGEQFNQFAEWVLWDNKTAIYYETWTVWSNETNGKMWFDSFDCASFVLRAFEQLGKVGTKFNQSVQLNYTRINLYSDMPIYLGNETEVMSNATLKAEILDFYRNFQSHQSAEELLIHLLKAYEEIFKENKFYLFYNYAYWFLPMKHPYIQLTYNEVPLPNPSNL